MQSTLLTELSTAQRDDRKALSSHAFRHLEKLFENHKDRFKNWTGPMHHLGTLLKAAHQLPGLMASRKWETGRMHGSNAFPACLAISHWLIKLGTLKSVRVTVYDNSVLQYTTLKSDSTRMPSKLKIALFLFPSNNDRDGFKNNRFDLCEPAKNHNCNHRVSMVSMRVTGLHLSVRLTAELTSWLVC